MPRTAKKGFTYYGFDTDHFYDPKVKRLKNKFGMEGWAVFHFIVNEIHRVEGYYMIMDSDGLFDVSDYSRMDEQRIAGRLLRRAGAFRQRTLAEPPGSYQRGDTEQVYGHLQVDPPQAFHLG